MTDQLKLAMSQKLQKLQEIEHQNVLIQGTRATMAAQHDRLNELQAELSAITKRVMGL